MLAASTDCRFQKWQQKAISTRGQFMSASRPVYFSTSNIRANKESSLSDFAKIRESITELLGDNQAYPPGSLTPELLQDAEEAIESWVSERNRDGFEKASAVLMRLVEEQAYQERNAEPDDDFSDKYLEYIYHVRPFLLNQVIDCWRTCWRDRLVDVTPSEILSMTEELETRGLVPDSRTLTLIVDGMILRGDPFEAPLLAQWLLDRRMEQAADDPERRPDTIFITNVIRSWAKSGRLEAPEMADGLLQLMHDLYDSGWTDSGPNTLTYGSTMEAWYRSRLPEAANSMEKLLEDMKNSSVEQVVPDRISYTYVINGWAHSRAKDGPRKAHNLLQEMIRLYEAGNDDVAPNASNFSRVMYALARGGDVEQVEMVFEQLQDLFSQTADPKFKPDDECWKAMVVALAKKGAAAEAQAILDELVEPAITEQNRSIMPKRSYFVDVMVSWSKHKDQVMASEQSQKVLMRLLDLSKSGYPDLMPDAKCFEKVMQTWSKTRHEGAARNVESLLLCMDQTYKETGKETVKPSGKAFQLALLAWSRSDKHDAPERAEALIREMEHRYDSGDTSMKPNRGTYTTLMLTWLRSGREEAHTAVQGIFFTLVKLYSEGHNHLRPDLYVYSVLMDSWAERGDANETQTVFDRMLDDYGNGNKDAKPDVHAFNKILKAWAFSKHANRAQEAESVFQKMKDFGQAKEFRLSPNRQTFNEMITVWSNSLEPNAAETAESYLKQLKENNLEPTLLSYRAAIDAWSRSKDSTAPARAEAILEELLSDVKSKKIRLPLYKPYRKFLGSIARSKIPRRNKQAQEMLDSLPRGQVPHSLLPPL
jgi:hypothetical protein